MGGLRLCLQKRTCFSSQYIGCETDVTRLVNGSNGLIGCDLEVGGRIDSMDKRGLGRRKNSSEADLIWKSVSENSPAVRWFHLAILLKPDLLMKRKNPKPKVSNIR